MDECAAITYFIGTCFLHPGGADLGVLHLRVDCEYPVIRNETAL